MHRLITGISNGRTLMEHLAVVGGWALLLNTVLGLPPANANGNSGNNNDRPILEEIRETGLLTVAMRDDAVPFGFREGPARQWSGVCVDFIQELQEQVSRKLGGQPLMVKFYQSGLVNRFSLVASRRVMLECGPNTIREHPPEGVVFSAPFFRTGTQLLVRADEYEQFTNHTDWAEQRIGVLVGSANQMFLAQQYPQADLVGFRGTNARRQGVMALMEGKIDAFASDGILLFGEAMLLELPLGRDYRFYPTLPLDCQSYGMILPADQLEWQALVNQTLASGISRDIYRRWLGPLFPALERVEDYCDRPTESTANSSAHK